MCMHPVSRAMLGCALALLLSASVGIAQPAEPKLPEGLRHVPLDAVGFIHVRAGDFLKSAVGQSLLQELQKDREAAKGLKKIEQTLGIEAADLESVTLLMLPPPTRSQMNPWEGPTKRSGFGLGMSIGPKAFSVDADLKKPDFKLEEQKFEDKKIEEKKDAAKESPVVFQDGGGRDPREYLGQPPDVAEDVRFMGPLVILTSTKVLDRKKILQSQLFPARSAGPNGSPRDFSVLFLSDRTVMVGPPWELARYSEAMARKPDPKTQPMKSALALAAEPHLVVAGGHLPVDLRRMIVSLFNHEMRELAPLSPLLQTEGGLTLDFDKSITLNLQFHASTEASAANALQAVKCLRVLAELALEKSREAAKSGGWKLQLEKGLTQALADASIEQKGTTVKTQLKMEFTPAIVKYFAKELVFTFRHRGDRTRSVNNLKQIALAMHNYHDTYRNLPPAGVSGINDPNGKPLLSWRVAILPHIEQQTLYRQFDLNQPWDHPTNKKLIARMPPIYVLPGADTKEGETHYRVLVGPTTMFEPRQGAGGKQIGIALQSVVDGTTNTIMVVEAKEPTIWTRPDDLPFDPKGPLPKFGVSPDGFHAAMGDGSVRFIRSTTPEEVLRAMITRNGGEAVDFEKWTR